MRNFSLHANKCAQGTADRSSSAAMEQLPVFRDPNLSFRTNCDGTNFFKNLPALMTTEDVLKALGRYRSESNENDRRTAALLGIKRATLIAWLQGTDPPQKPILARLAGFLRRVGYL